MVLQSPPSPDDSLSATLAYFARYHYPLTLDELWFWQHGTQLSRSRIHLPRQDFSLRKKRELISQDKWRLTRRVGESLSQIPFIQALFVTGSLAMNNADSDADIDLMVITSPNTLWLTRLLVFFLIHSLRRRPGVSSAPNKVCDNLYLDLNHLQVTPQDLYRAHEILQAKCVFDRIGIHRLFLLANSWVGTFLPVAYRESLKKLSPTIKHLRSKIYSIFMPLNLFLFLLQYLYMKPKITTERIAPGFAFFHPKA